MLPFPPTRLEAGLAYSQLHSRNKAEEFTLDQDTIKMIDGIVSETEDQENKAKDRPSDSPNKVRKIVNEGNERSASIDGKERKTASSNRTNLQRKEELDSELRQQMEQKMSSPEYQSMYCKRKQLPTFAEKQEFLDLVDNNQVVLISGETGSGKTTQLPQYLLEHAVLRGNGSCTRIVVTQPRRISTISVAERVASERGESLGMDIGYQIRLESKLPSHSEGSVLFCTTGIVLQWFHSDPLLQAVSHIVVDEVHEREMLGDFLMVMLKRILPRRPDLHVILMSATMNSMKFSEYFDNCPHLKIPGRTFPVESIFLEEVLCKTGYRMSIEGRMNVFKFNKGKNECRTGSVVEPNITAEDRENYKCWVQECHDLSLGSQDFLRLINVNLCPPPEFIAHVIDYIAKNCDPGAILVFVPGSREIKDVTEELQKIGGKFYGDGYGSGAVIYPLHSRLTMANQRAVFDTPPGGKRKIVIAANIAETSITIEDIVYVVDSGQIKITTYDPRNNTSTLAPVLVSKANADQRKGRAGRVREGKCFHLFPSFTYNNVMLDFLPPEITQTRLEDVILRIKLLNLGPVTDFLSHCLDPPELETIRRTIRFLRDIQALRPLPQAAAVEESVDSVVEEDNDVLTPLGYHLANFPLDPQCAKLLILGALFCCLRPALAVAACLNFKSPFEVSHGKEHIANAKHRGFAGNSQSDHWAFYQALRDLLRLMQDFVELLYERQYIKSEDMDDPDVNLYSRDVKIFRAIIAGAFYPNFVMASANIGQFGPSSALYRSSTKDEEIALHSNSVSVVFDTAMLNARPVVFFSSRLDHVKLDDTNYHKVDDWITLRANPRIPQLVGSLKQGLDGFLNDEVCNPGPVKWDKSSPEGQITKTIVNYFLDEELPTFSTPAYLQRGRRCRVGRRFWL